MSVWIDGRELSLTEYRWETPIEMRSTPEGIMSKILLTEARKNAEAAVFKEIDL